MSDESLSSELESRNWAGADLTEADFEFQDLSRANFHRAILKNANFYHANLEDANFQDADLCGTNLRDANLLGANLTNAKIDSGTRFEGAILDYGIVPGSASPRLQRAKCLRNPHISTAASTKTSAIQDQICR
jgi:uncharacterized protein YjbI with pentapeptide repeats